MKILPSFLSAICHFEGKKKRFINPLVFSCGLILASCFSLNAQWMTNPEPAYLMSLPVSGTPVFNVFEIKGNVFSGNTPLSNLPVYITALPVAGSPVFFSDTVRTNSSGFFSSLTYPGGALAPYQEWLVSAFDSCTGEVVSDTVSNCNGRDSTVTQDQTVIRTDTSLSSCVTGSLSLIPVISSGTFSLITPLIYSLPVSTQNFILTENDLFWEKQELCTNCSAQCYYANIYGDSLDQIYLGKYYDEFNDMLYSVGYFYRGGNPSMYLTKIDGSGNLVMVKEYPVSPGVFPSDLIMAPNGDLLITGDVRSEAYFILRITSSGNLLWGKKYAIASFNSSPQIIQSDIGNYIIGGSYTNTDNVTFLKIDGSGNALWTQTIRYSHGIYIHDMVANGNGGAIFTGRVNAFPPVPYLPYLGEIDVNGSVVSLKTLNISFSGFLSFIIRTMDGGYALSVGTANGIELVKIDSALNISWVRTFGPLYTNLTSIIQDDYGSYYISAKHDVDPDPWTNNFKGVVVKLDANGNFIWSKALDHVTDNVPSAGVQFELLHTSGTPDNIIIIGSSNTQPSGTGAPCAPGFVNLFTCTTCNNDPLNIKSLTLMDEGLLGEVGILHDGRIINRDTLCRFSIRANVCQSVVGSVKFILNGSTFKVENIPPYAIAGDNSSGFIPWTPAPGNYTLTVIAYSGPSTTGQSGAPYTVNFMILPGQSLPCLPPVGCPNGCSDNNPCTVDTCVNDNCSFTTINCNDNDICTLDACNNGVCTHTQVSHQPAYLKVTNTSVSWRKLKLGYSSASLWIPRQDVMAGGNNMLCITLRDALGNAPWNKIQVRPQGHSVSPATLSNYLSSSPGTGPFTVCIPLSAFYAVDFTQLSMIEVPYSNGATAFEIHLEKIEFKGGTSPFLWFGDTHINNYHDGQSGSSSALMAVLVPGQQCSSSKWNEEEEAYSLAPDQRQSFLTAFPNPFADVVTVSFSLPVSVKVRLELRSADGKVVDVLYQGVIRENDAYSVEYNAERLSNGIYFYRLITDGGIILNGKLLIMKH